MGKRRRQGKENMGKKRTKSAEKESTEGPSAPSFICPTPTERGSDQYDVFLSFEGSDTRKKFTDHLYHSLVNAGTLPISVFKDDKSITVGEKFASQIFGAITRSKISIPIISKNYAASKWCLRELVHMMDSRKSTSHIVLPIFYEVKPSDVGHLQGKFGDAYHSRKECFDKDDIPKFEQALRDVSRLQVWGSEKIASGHEGELVQKVVDTVLSELRHDFQLDVTKHLVGIDDHVNKIRNWAHTSATHARMIGIYGMGGIGKTTLAKAIYNKLSKEFGGVSYISDIRDKAADGRGIPYVQNQLIKDICPDEREVSEVDHGISLIKSRFKYKKVLIILDNIDHKNQLNALARERDWFMAGSIIIVTTRDEAVLDESEFGVDLKYPMNELDEELSLLLFNKHAFRMSCAPRGFEDISHEIVTIMDGLPLALKVVGEQLRRETNQALWQEVLENLRKEPHVDVQKELKICFDALGDRHQKIFLDIACFFIGKESKYPIYMWKDCEYLPLQGIKKLTQRCLIKIGEHEEFRMQYQWRVFGRSFFCQGQQPERCIRLLHDDEEAFRRQLHRERRDWTMRGPIETYTSERFKDLPSSRFLQLCGKALSGDFNELFSELSWLRWLYIGPDMSFSVINLHLHKLVVLELSRNKLTKDWEGWSSIMAAKRLKVLDLSYSQDLRCTLDLSTFTELEILILKGCWNLEQIHPSIGKVKRLVSLDLTYCGNLKKLPPEVGELEELKELLLDCAGITEIPKSIDSLRKLEKLSASSCRSLVEIPSSIGNLQYLQLLDISYSAIEKLPSAIGRLQNLRELHLKSCDGLKGHIPREIGDLSSLEIILFAGTSMSHRTECIQNLSFLQRLGQRCYKELQLLPALPSGLTYLHVDSPIPRLPQLFCLIHLKELHLYGCNQLEYIPELPLGLLKLCADFCPKLILPKLDKCEYLEELSVKHCNSIERLILPKLQWLKRVDARGCKNLVEIRGLDKAELLEALDISDCGCIERLPDLTCFRTLKELNINGCCNLISVESLEGFLSCRSIYIAECHSLEKLPNLSKFENLENFILINSFGVKEILGVGESRSLKQITIIGCKEIETLPDLSGCENLRCLELQDCKKLTQLQGLEALDLRRLSISRCDSLETQPDLPGLSDPSLWNGAVYDYIILR